MTGHTRPTLGDLLRTERRRRKERQLDTAARFGISQPSYWRWESDAGHPSDHQLAAVAKFLGITGDQLLELIDRRVEEERRGADDLGLVERVERLERIAASLVGAATSMNRVWSRLLEDLSDDD